MKTLIHIFIVVGAFVCLAWLLAAFGIGHFALYYGFEEVVVITGREIVEPYLQPKIEL